MPPSTASGGAEAREARDVMAFGQEIGRVLSGGRVVGRAEPFAKVFASSRLVKRAVGLAAWGVLEDVALDAALDGRGRLVAETNVRRIAGNLGLNKDTVTKYLRRLREYGFVLQEEGRAGGSGRYDTCRYLLDPSACVERFTHTPRKVDTAEFEPRPKPSDTVLEPVSEDTGHGGTGHGGVGHLQTDGGVVSRAEQQQTGGPVGSKDRQRLRDLGVAGSVADELIGGHPAGRVGEVLDAVASQPVRSPAGWVVKALRDGWDVSDLVAEHRRAKAREQRYAEQTQAEVKAARAEREQRQRADGWAAAVSAALDDGELIDALVQTTTPPAGLNRRSAPLARAQLIAWAAAVAERSPRQPVHEAMAAELAAGASPAAAATSAILPPPPSAARAGQDLLSRIRVCLARLGQPATAGAAPVPTVGRTSR